MGPVRLKELINTSFLRIMSVYLAVKQYELFGKFVQSKFTVVR